MRPWFWSIFLNIFRSFIAKALFVALTCLDEIVDFIFYMRFIQTDLKCFLEQDRHILQISSSKLKSNEFILFLSHGSSMFRWDCWFYFILHALYPNRPTQNEIFFLISSKVRAIPVFSKKNLTAYWPIFCRQKFVEKKAKTLKITFFENSFFVFLNCLLTLVINTRSKKKLHLNCKNWDLSLVTP